ncbi:immunoglobulin-like domain-containing receptor 1a [Aplochiton taeniatus]
MLFASVTLRCDYSTSANLQQVLVTWRYKSFCKDPIIDYYSTGYQAALQLGQNPADDCPDSQRTVRVVAQKSGSNEAVLGAEYRERKITIQNNANLVITEIMWWDNGMYYCSIDAPGDTTGDSDKEIQLIVYNWLTALLIIFGALMLILLLCICCCQCCPQKCCCYVRCPCCPQTCCCPEKAVMQHRMIKDAQRAMQPWLGGQPLYAPMSNGSSQMNPLLYSGSVSGKNIPMGPMPLPPPQSMAYSMPPPGPHGHHSPAGTNQVLDFLENQVRGMDMTSPLLQPQQPGGPYQFHPQHMHMQGPPPPPHMAHSVPFSPGPPSMLSALDERDVGGRRVITLPPIVDQPLGRGPPRLAGTRPPSSSASSRSGYARRRDDRGGSGGDGGRRYPSPPRSRGIPRSYSEESLDGHRRGDGPRSVAGMGRPRSRSRDDLFDSRSRGNYSPPASRRSKGGSWSSDDESSSRRGGGGGGRRKNEKPPNYTEYEPGQKPVRRSDRYSDKSSRSGTSVVI